MTKKGYTDITLILDRSGSMSTIKAEAENALNSYIEDQKKEAGECTVQLISFDNKYERTIERTSVQDFPRIKIEPRGMTALLDAVGRATIETGAYYNSLSEDQRPERVLIVVITDGAENSSHEYNDRQIKEIITHQQEKYGWTYVFLGANIDAIQTASQYGISADTTLQFATTDASVRASAASLSSLTASYRTRGVASFSDEDRKAALDNDNK